MEEKQELLGGQATQKRSCPSAWLLLLLLPLSLAALLLLPRLLPQPLEPPCQDTCRVQLVESIPEGLVFNSSVEHLSTHAAWSQLIGLAEEEIHLAGMYWTLRGQDVFPSPSAWAGEDIFRQLLEARRDRGLELRIAQNAAKPGSSPETEELAEAGA